MTLSRSESAHSRSGDKPLFDLTDPSLSMLGPLEEYVDEADADDLILAFRALALSSIS